jgi:hypothetical protein
MDGGASAELMPFLHASSEKLGKTIPKAQRRTIAGEDHSLDEKVLAPILKEFFLK